MPFCEYCGHELDSDASFCPNCGKAVKRTVEPVAQAPVPKPEERDGIPDFNIQSVLIPGETVEWHMDFMEGVLHRHPKETYAITNSRVLAIDRLTAKLAIALPIKDTDITVMNRHSESGGFSAGVYHEGFYGGMRVSSSTEVG